MNGSFAGIDISRCSNLFPDFITFCAITSRILKINDLHQKIGWLWVAQAKNECLCSMYVRKKHNRLGATSAVVVSKASGKYTIYNLGEALTKSGNGNVTGKNGVSGVFRGLGARICSTSAKVFEYFYRSILHIPCLEF